ncbi:MAG: CDP-alcohol phosphatidyltransferase family protein [Clostridiaceae bacterium]|jgi:CDP-diacylglycerol--glycerol-3-phosphate 3-phosphatidyltransferase|nr:CDP-alcohol phosphatidyltransferase family protein [Clostridiaceae bacterium]
MEENKAGTKPKSQLNMRELFMIPNLICVFRILCIPVFILLCVFAAINNDINLVWGGLAVFTVASASDIIDGKIARRYNMVSGLGKMLDPLADKLMHVAVLMCLAFALWYIHWAFVILILVKELLMIVLSLIFAGKGITIQANMLGKVGSAAVSGGVILAFFTALAGEPNVQNPIYVTVTVILSIALAIGYGAAINYLYQIVQQLKGFKIAKEQAEETEVDKSGVAEEAVLAEVVPEENQLINENQEERGSSAEKYSADAMAFAEEETDNG